MALTWDFARQISDSGTPGGTTSFFNEEMQSLFLKDGMIQTGVGTVEEGHWQDSVAGSLIPLSDIGYSALDVEHLHNTRLYASVVKNGSVMLLMHVYNMG